MSNITKIQTLEHVLVMCRYSRFISEETAKWFRETLQFLQTSLEKEIPESAEKMTPFFSILEIAIQNMEQYTLEGNREAFYFEADHVHNIDEIFVPFFSHNQQREQEYVLDYYLRFTRKFYKEKADPMFAARFQNDWNTLESFTNKSVC